MRYMGEIANREVVLIQYYNVLFHLIFSPDYSRHSRESS